MSVDAFIKCIFSNRMCYKNGILSCTVFQRFVLLQLNWEMCEVEHMKFEIAIAHA